MSWVLPMFTGREDDEPRIGFCRFIKDGSEKDMHTSLMLSVGKTIKVLRSHTLKSKYAPIMGIRYDGEWVIPAISWLEHSTH